MSLDLTSWAHVRCSKSEPNPDPKAEGIFRLCSFQVTRLLPNRDTISAMQGLARAQQGLVGTVASFRGNSIISRLGIRLSVVDFL